VTTRPARPTDSPYIDFDRETWAGLAASTPLPFTEADVQRISALGEPIALDEVDAILRPLSRLLHLHANASGRLHLARRTFLQDTTSRTPYVIGIAGSVAVGKSTIARVLAELIARSPDTPRVALIPTDGFLHPNAELKRRGLMDRKGFPESYDRHALLHFLALIKSGAATVPAPVYDHISYDIVPGERTTVRHPDVLIIEGLNVLQPAAQSGGEPAALVVSDFFDFSIYIDAATPDIRTWYIERFSSFRDTAFTLPNSYFKRYATLADAEVPAVAGSIWDTINEPNLARNILPTRSRATLILTKGADHRVEHVRLRKI
jgi:type I pantothenate kinase